MWSSRMEPIVTQTRKVLILLAGVSLAAALSACATTDTPDDPAKPTPITPTERFAIEVQPQPQELRLATHGSGISANQAQALGVFAQKWMDLDGGEVVVQSPTHGADPGAAYRTSSAARDALVAAGVSPDKIRIVGYDGAGDVQAPIIVGFSRYVAKGPQCGQNWENLTATKDNGSYENFGCAVTANMAAQIADPGDLLQPREMTPADAGRRQVVLDHYRKGETTSSAKDSQADGAVSRAVP